MLKVLLQSLLKEYKWKLIRIYSCSQGAMNLPDVKVESLRNIAGAQQQRIVFCR